MADPVPGKQYMTVAVTDLALCLACVYAFRSHMHSSYAFVGFLLFAAAAGTGVLRFALFPGQRVVKRAHEYLSDAVGKVGLPFIALEFVVIARVCEVPTLLITYLFSCFCIRSTAITL